MSGTGRALGAAFESFIEFSNKYYRNKNIMLVQKIATPMTPVRRGNRIVSAYYEEKSTLDYIGVYKGRAIAFDAKRSQTNTFQLSNIQDHQIQFMKEWTENGGYSFLLIEMAKHDKIVILEYEKLYKYIERRNNNIGKDGKVKRGYSSITIEQLLKDGFEVENKRQGFLDYEKVLRKRLK